MIFYRDFDFSLLKDEIEKDGIIEVGNKDKKYFSDTIFTLDTETTSYFILNENIDNYKKGTIINFNYEKDNDFYKSTIKQGLMYIWMFGINDYILYGRSYEDMKDFFHIFLDNMKINNIPIIPIIYIHNLGFDFEFIQNALGTNWEIFAREPHKPIYVKNDRLEFRCSYFLTNKSLDSYAKDYNLSVQKQVGKLDYNVLRTPYTLLTEEELCYCEYDIKVLKEIISLHKKQYKYIQNIPYTKTGKVRRKINALFFKDKKYHERINNALPRTFDDFALLCQAFQGGYTHANYLNANKEIKDNKNYKILSYDITSSYIFEICTKKFPMYYFAKSTQSISKIDREKYSFIVDFVVNDLESKTSNNFLSISKAYTKENYIINNPIEDNGRIMSAKSCRYILTDVDFDIFCNAYSFSKIKILNLYISEKEYLPLNIIQFVLDLYKKKTELKGIEGKESLYIDYKEDLNSVYGMFCTKILQDDVLYKSGNWEKEEMTEEKGNEKLYEMLQHNNNLNFSWGVWVAAYARYHLWRNIFKLGGNLIYSDTDSWKFKTFKGYENIFEEDKKYVNSCIYKICDYYKELKPLDYSPVDKKGNPHTLGYAELDGEYKEFKTLGAKKYAYKDIEGKMHITISGVNKKTGAEAIKNLKYFQNNFVFDYKTSGKMEVYYNNQQQSVIFPDGYKDDGKYGVCLKPATYRIGLTPEYLGITTKILD